MIFAAGNFDAPIETGARNRQVFQAAFNELYRFIFPAIGSDKVRMRGIIFEQRLFIFRKPEKPAFFNRPFNLCALRRKLLASLALSQFGFVIISFVADRIPSFIPVKIQVASGLKPFPNRLAGLVVMVRRCAAKMIKGTLRSAYF